jgi:hypothetical protein
MLVTETKKDTVVNGQFKTSGFRIEASSKAFQLLSSNIYKYKVRAIIRELSCNAIDANKESGSSEPVLVHLPTRLEPWFSVRDNGNGLTEEQIFEVFTVYFCSTKTGSNDYIGKFGLGAKSPYCLVDNFIVNSFNSGIKYSYSAYKDENDLPQMALLTSSPSEEMSGLEVIVNVDGRESEFEREAIETFKYFDVLPKINSERVSNEIEKQRQWKVSTPTYCLNCEAGECKAVMGNVAYDIPYGYGLSVQGFIRFEIGELDFDLGRESLSLDDKTRNNLERRVREVKDGLVDHLVSVIEAEPTPFKKALLFEKMNSGKMGEIITVNRNKFNYVLPKSSTPIMYYKRGWRSISTGNTDSLPLGVRYFAYKPKFSTRIKAYMRDNAVSMMVLLSDSQIAETLIDPEYIEDLDIVPKIEYNRSKSKPVKVKSLVNGSSWREDVVDFSEEFIYVELSYGKPENYNGNHGVTTLLAGAAALGIEIDKVYGLAPSVKKKGAGIELTEYLREHVQVPSVALMNTPAYADMLKHVDSRFTKKPIDENVRAVYNLVGKVTHDTTLDELSKEYVKAYPLIPCIKWESWNKPDIKTILTYLKKLN